MLMIHNIQTSDHVNGMLDIVQCYHNYEESHEGVIQIISDLKKLVESHYRAPSQTKGPER